MIELSCAAEIMIICWAVSVSIQYGNVTDGH